VASVAGSGCVTDASTRGKAAAGERGGQDRREAGQPQNERAAAGSRAAQVTVGRGGAGAKRHSDRAGRARQRRGGDGGMRSKVRKTPRSQPARAESWPPVSGGASLRRHLAHRPPLSTDAAAAQREGGCRSVRRSAASNPPFWTHSRATIWAVAVGVTAQYAPRTSVRAPYGQASSAHHRHALATACGCEQATRVRERTWRRSKHLSRTASRRAPDSPQAPHSFPAPAGWRTQPTCIRLFSRKLGAGFQKGAEFELKTVFHDCCWARMHPISPYNHSTSSCKHSTSPAKYALAGTSCELS